MYPATAFAGKKVAVFGLARSGLACVESLASSGADVCVWDDRPAAVEKAEAAGFMAADLRAANFAEFDSLVLSPGVPLTHPDPHWTVKKAQAAGVEIIGDTEVFARELPGSGARTVCITGTNGKSTTTALIGHVLKSAGLDTHIGGNIGTAVCLLPPPQQDRVYVVEFSSYQIDLTPSLAPDVAVLLNLSPDHLDRHGTMEHYASVKARIFDNQRSGARAIVSVDDQWCQMISAQVPSSVDAVRMSVLQALEDGVSAPEGQLRDQRAGKVLAEIDLTAMATLRGRHNWQNACAAYSAARALGLEPAAIEAGMRSFPGLAHRMEQVARRGRVLFVNDSKATNADAVEKALSSFERIYWIAGGRAKEGGIDGLAHLFGRVAHAYLIGEAADGFAGTLGTDVAFTKSGTLAQAVSDAARDAASDTSAEPVVLLSPACASFDQFTDFETRGEAFRTAVMKLDGLTNTGNEAA